ncbi:MAG: HAD-IA family hydrolase [Clostridia bacterium]
MKYAVKNPRNLTAGQVNDFSAYLWEEVCGPIRKAGYELHNLSFQKLLYESLGIEFSIRPEEQEQVFWDNTASGARMPNIEVLLNYLYENAIRSGVVSNIGFSGNALSNRINRLLPDNHFEFIIATSEYMVRKPNPLIFNLALSKAGLSADEVWYCGDDTENDVMGAFNAGIYPVWYHSFIPNDWRDKTLDEKPECEHLYINDWLELIDILEGLK